MGGVVFPNVSYCESDNDVHFASYPFPSDFVWEDNLQYTDDKRMIFTPDLVEETIEHCYKNGVDPSTSDCDCALYNESECQFQSENCAWEIDDTGDDVDIECTGTFVEETIRTWEFAQCDFSYNEYEEDNFEDNFNEYMSFFANAESIVYGDMDGEMFIENDLHFEWEATSENSADIEIINGQDECLLYGSYSIETDAQTGDHAYVGYVFVNNELLTKLEQNGTELSKPFLLIKSRYSKSYKVPEFDN